ncbi:MAG: hypothetical protein C3F13_14920 [Anaerolineales bacterium]|nr:DUF1269 domain-containing protein [Anaerolineae bacterium]PWB51150.1 MAG: hypothetical protein C3F13_14920 [Anaerolineales bacterium]
MATLTVLKFSAPDGASEMLEKIKSLQKRELIKIQDAAIVSWPPGKKAPKTRQMVDMAGMGAMQGAFWGMLFGLIFFVPFFGLAVGAAFGALGGKMADYGISDEFIKNTREKVTEGTSALFLLTTGAIQDEVLAELKGSKFELIASDLTKEQEDALKEAFAEE